MATLVLPKQRTPRPKGRCIQRFRVVLTPEPRLLPAGWHMRHGDPILTDVGGHTAIVQVDIARHVRRRKGITPEQLACIATSFLKDVIFIFGKATRMRPIGWGSSVHKGALFIGSVGSHNTLAERLCAKDGGYVGRLLNTEHERIIKVEGARIKVVKDTDLGCEDTMVMSPGFVFLHELPRFMQGTLNAGVFAKGTIREALDNNEMELLGDADLLVPESTVKGRVEIPDDGVLGILAKARPLTIGGTPLLAINSIEFPGHDPTLTALLVAYAHNKFKDALLDVYATIEKFASMKTEDTRLGPKIARALRMWRLGFNPSTLGCLYITQEVLLKTLAKALRQIVRSFGITMSGGIGFSWAGADALAKSVGRPIVITNMSVDDCVVVRAPTLSPSSMVHAVVVHPSTLGIELPDGVIILSKDIQDLALGDTDGDLFALLYSGTFKNEWNTDEEAERLYQALLSLIEDAQQAMADVDGYDGHVVVTDKVPGPLTPHTVASQVGESIGKVFGGRQGTYTNALKASILADNLKYAHAFAQDVDQSTKLQKRALATDDSRGLTVASMFAKALGDTRTDLGGRGCAYQGRTVACIDGTDPIHDLAELCNESFCTQRENMPVIPINNTLRPGRLRRHDLDLG